MVLTGDVTASIHAHSEVERNFTPERSGGIVKGKTIGLVQDFSETVIVKALPSEWPEPRKQLPPRATRLDPFKPLIDEMLRADLDAPRQQRHTVKRILERL